MYLPYLHPRECTVRTYHVYILASRTNGTLYIGVTSDLVRRVQQHKTDAADGFTKKYTVHNLVYCESTGDVESAIRREKQLKEWKREWKVRLIESVNPTWRDLYEDLVS